MATGEGEAEAPAGFERAEEALPTAPATDRAFFTWSVAVYGAVLVLILGVSLLRTGGDLVYVIDDPAIHLSMAETLAFDGTWGVEAGRFESVSSSPLWTSVLALLTLVVPTGREWLPLVLNVAAGVGLLALLGANQTVLRPSRHRLLHVAAVAALVVIVLFLPGLAMVGMEHTLHMLLVVGAVAVFARRSEEAEGRRWLPYALLVAATLVRFETVFVAAGIGVALLVRCVPRLASPGRAQFRSSLRRAVVVALASGVPVALYAIVNLTQGQSFLPNSVLAKSVGGQAFDDASGVQGVGQRLVADPLVALVAVVALTYLISAWLGGPRRNVFGATVLVVTIGLHVWLARIGWYERYQAYVLALGVLVGLAIASEVLRPSRRDLVPALLVAVLLFAPGKWQFFQSVPTASDSTHDHHHAAGRFLAEHYDGEPVATGELGYISLFHDGPVTDLNGLADHEVLTTRLDGDDTPRYWAELARRRRFDVAAVFPQTLLLDTPRDWILVGEWTFDHPFSALDDRFQFWATTPDAADPLRDRLNVFVPDMPPGVALEINEFVDLRVADVRARQGGG